MSLKNIRIAVVGAGMMGQNHLRIYNMLSGIELVAVVDTNEALARSAARAYHCHAYTTIEDLIGKVDAVSIAVPSSLHAEIGVYLLDQGIHCLIEKPLALTEFDCLRLIEAAERKGLILLVGHVEHFNPAVQELIKIMSNGPRIYAIDVKRMSGNSGRITDVDVVMDLMIHDLEIVNALVNRPVNTIFAQGISHSKGTGQDYVSSLLTFSGDTIASITASRITQNKVRKLEITSDIGHICLDYSAQELLIYRQKGIAEFGLNGGCILDQSVERVLVRPTEPLISEIQNFIQSIHAGIPLGVTAKQAFEALKLVWGIQACFNKNEQNLEMVDRQYESV